MAQNIQTFAGDVVVPGTLRANLVTIEDPILTLGSNNYVDKASNTGFIINRFDSNANVAFYFDETNEQLRLAYTDSVGTDKNIIVDEETDLEINVFGYVSAYGFRGDGGLLSNLVTDLQSVTEYGASSDQTLVLSNVTTALDATQGNVVVSGNVTASTFFGDGANLTGIAATLEEIIINGNVTSNVMELQNATSLITTGKVGIMNATPQHDLSVGANLYVEDVGSNVLTVEGNISAHQITLGTIEIIPSYGLENVTNVSNISYQTLILSNAQTAFVSTGKAGIGIEPDAGDVGVSGLHVDGHLRLGGAADNTDEESMDIKAAGALNVLANESDTDNTNTALLLRAGGVNESNITMYGDLSTADKQYMSFATRSEERMRIDRYGNVSIGHTAGNYMFDVAGDANVQSLTVQDLTINTIGLSVYYDVDNILENGNVTTNVLTVGKVTVTDPTLAQTASNLVTWNATTKEFEDSGGLISNKLAIVSEQPPSALTANSTTVTDHGVYKLTTSGLASNSNTWNAFNGDASDAWTSVSTYTGTDNAYGGSVQLSTVSSTGSGEWLAVEFPYKTTLRHMKLTPAAVASYPGTANLYATNDTTSWTLLKEWSDVVPGSASEVQTVVVNSAAAYKKYAIVTTKVAGDSITASLAEWKLFCESFTVDGGKVKLASSTITGGNTVVDQTGPHARASPLRKYPEVALTSNVHGGYVVSASSNYSDYAFPTQFVDWLSFNGLLGGTGPGWVSDDSPVGYDSSTRLATGNGNDNLTGIVGVNGVRNGAWLKLKLPHKIKLKEVHLYDRYLSPNERVYEAYIYGSNDDSTWYTLGQQSTGTNLTTYTDRTPCVVTISDQTTAYKYFIVQPTQLSSQHAVTYASYGQVELYGYEETSDPDTSVDTTITSQFNLPDTTGVKLYIDGDKGSTPTDYSGEGHTLTDESESFSGNAWSFSSLATSNVTMSTGDLAMEGVHPHSVSLWFNCANVTSNATLFHVGTAAGEGDAKTSISLTETGHLGWIDGGDNQFLSSNTWHNLVYTTQGAGGVRTCYLDGRKLGDAQVQDTFGEYPPFAMTTYSEYGYTVSASGVPNGTYAPYHAFNNTVAEGNGSWHSGFTYETSGSRESTTSTLSSWTGGGGGHNGEWLKIEVPFKLVLNSITFRQRTAAPGQHPRLFSIVGSNDDSNWYLVHEEVSRTFATANAPDPDSHTMTGPYAGTAWKYFAVVIRTGATDNTYNHVAIGDWQLYGHKENDTTRFPISSTVLKYPHIAMTGPAQRGYVVSASSQYHDNNYPPYNAFNNVFTGSDPTHTWNSKASAYNTSSGEYNGSDNFSTTISGTAYAGEWIQIELPRKVVASALKLGSYGSNSGRSPRDGTFAGSNDGSTWDLLKTYSGETSWTQGTLKSFAPSNNTTTAYKYFRFVITHVQVSNDGLTALQAFEVHGTEPEDVIARVGEGLDGKVANFRVYDKYLHEEQALELWDAQKDQFGVATSSVVVHRGRLGVGTTEPEGRFAVLDEPGDMEEFPPRAMTAAETHMEGHGVFKASASSVMDTNSWFPWMAFDKNGAYGWHSRYTGQSGGGVDGTGTTWYSSDGTYGGPNSLGGYRGEWIHLEMPYKVKLNKLLFLPRYSVPKRSPQDGVLLGSNDGLSWTVVHSWSGVTSYVAYEYTEFDISTSSYFSHYALVSSKLITDGNTDSLQIMELRYFGTRQGQSTLHDGELKLTKNLTVPRIGPPLDADDTPQRDKLVVEYNTSTNPTENGVVRDTSGRGLDGLTYNGASYDATEKALVFDGSNDYVKIDNIGNPAGGWAHSFSAWFKLDNTPSGEHLFQIGNGLVSGSFSPGNSYSGLYFSSTQTGWYFYSNDHAFDFIPAAGTWYHIVGIYPGGSAANRTLYVNGVKQSVKSGTTPGTLTWDVEANSDLAIGADWSRHDTGYGTPIEGQSHWMEGSISNFKLYDVALAATEVKRLYDMGRCDEGHHVVNFSKTRVGIGLGDGEAPSAALEVRNGANIGGDVNVGNNTGVVTLQAHPFTTVDLGPSTSSTLTQFDTADYKGIWLATLTRPDDRHGDVGLTTSAIIHKTNGIHITTLHSSAYILITNDGNSIKIGSGSSVSKNNLPGTYPFELRMVRLMY